MLLPIILLKVDLLNFSIYCNIVQNPPKKLLEQVRDVIRLKHYSYRTEETYVQWIVRYILFHNKRYPKDMGVPEIEEFLTHLAVEGIDR
jgi:Phage integrase, N-terminal SAM-like domain